ncbi:MAG: hypothetical protein LBJ00_07835 [Planctomycetaceae bacterium]|jgi:hypothetical protein|nr:hypothetical protein [Planctomycetaceae bacterium]
MSLFQPIIATAFSNYGVLRGSYAYRDSDNTVGGAFASKRLNNADKTNSASEPQKTKPVNNPDAGKIKNTSGDILDISDKRKTTSELSGAYVSRSNNVAETNKSDQSEFKSSSIETQDTRIDVADSSPKTLSAAEESSDVADKELSFNADSKLTEEETEQVRKLQERDVEVRQHEAAHLAVAGQYAQGGAEYTFQTGPDGKKYAIGGSVSIDVSEVEGDPEATIAKMQQVAAAANAPAEPSNQDLKVAAAARSTEAKARMELAKEKAEDVNTPENESAEVAAPESKKPNSPLAQSAATNKNNSQQTTTDKILKSFVTSAYTNQSTLSSNMKNGINRVNIFV